MWTGSISFGLVSIPIKLYKATESHDVSFHQAHDADGGRIKYSKVCADCGEVVDQAHIHKVAKFGDQEVTVSAEELSSLQDEQPKTIEVLQFVDEDEIDPLAFESSYYCGPGGPLNGYHLLRTAMEDTGRVAIARVTLRTRTSLALLRVTHGNVITMHTLSWTDEVRTPQFADLNKPFEVKPQELQVAKMLVDSMSGSFKPEDYTDVYHERVLDLLAAKAGTGEFTPAAKAEPVKDDVTDLMSMLQASIDAQGLAASKERHPAGKAGAAKPAKKAPAKAAPRKRGAA
jgi:DNA end-binding protein Ku